MQQFLSVRKAFLIVALVFVLNYVLGTVTVLQFNLSDPNIGGSARDSWLTSGTQLGAPAWFMAFYVILLVLATRQRWIDAWYCRCHITHLDVRHFVDNRLGYGVAYH